MKSTPKVKARRQPLEERFSFAGDDPRAHGNTSMLRGAVYAVYDKLAEADRGLRVWRKTHTAIDGDLRELWVHELRQIRRLMATAGAADVIVELMELVEDDDEFGIVLADCGQSLALLRSRAAQNHWLQSLRGRRPRALLWGNIRRLAHALGLVHSQGLVHGSLSADTVMTHGSQDPDFRLTGFEWSMWFAAPPDAAVRPDTTAATLFRQAEYSFAADWRALGQLVADLIGVTFTTDGQVVNSPSAVDIVLSAQEAALIRKLVHPAVAEMVDSPSIIRGVDDIVSDLLREGSAGDGILLICMAAASGLPKAVAKATAGDIPVDRRREQLEWAEADMASGATLFVLPRSPTGGERFRLLTATMAYELVPMPDADGTSSWDIALCESASLLEDQRSGSGPLAVHELVQKITFQPSRRDALGLRARLGSQVLGWSAFQSPADAEADGDATVIRRALVLVQVVEAYTKALEILPVDAGGVVHQDGVTIVTLHARDDTRDAIASEIGIGNTETALRRLFEDDGRKGDGRWLVGISGALDGHSSDVQATYLDFTGDGADRGYRFELDGLLPEGSRLFLRSKQESGSGAAVRRRLRNIAAMSDQPSLADLLDDPWLVRREARDELEEDCRFKELDTSKQTALRGIWKTLPLFAVVGPPGVGKTYLAEEVVMRRFKLEPSSRILLTAQGHQALNHLQEKVTGALSLIGRQDALVVRTRSRRWRSDDDDPGGDVDEAEEVDTTRLRVTEVLQRLASSSVAESLPLPFRKRLDGAAASAATVQKDSELRRAYRATAELLLDSANVVVSTTNSAEVERMVAEKASFDAVIFEEAAKATGPELVGALGLSGRHLMIGDHNQLPPFDADRMESILSDDGLVRRVLASANEMVGSWFRNDEITDLKEAAAEGKSFGSVVRAASRMVQPFRSIVKRDEARAASGGTAQRMSAVLSEQRRMDPAISEIVSKSFYGGKLIDAPRKPSPGIDCLAPLPASPVVVVNFQHVNRTGLRESAEIRLRGYHNPGELESVFHVLRLMRATKESDPPTLAILTPYSEQMRQIRSRMETERARGTLPNLAHFLPVRAELDFVGTVDSFQGSEADVVIVSLVRNNPRTGRAGLGFLSDPRRMNVLLSRAKSKLILVGSLRFLREAVRGVDPGDEKIDLRFLTTMGGVIEELSKRHGNGGVPLASIIAPDVLVPAA